MAHLVDPAPDPYQGRLIAGTFELVQHVGSDDLGRRYLARHATFGRRAEVRVLHGSHLQDAALVARLRQSALAAGHVDHPNVARIDAAGQEEDGTVFVASEYLDGRTLREVVAEEGPLDPARVVRLVAQVCSGLSAAHAAGIVHRDVRPDNIIIVDREGDDGLPLESAKLVGFGGALILSAPAQGVLPQGEPGFMSPEQCGGQPVDARSDLYSVGCLAYFLATGAPPYSGDPLAVIQAHLSTPATPPSQVRPGIPPALDTVILRAMAKVPGLRYVDARALRSALVDVRIDSPGRAEPEVDVKIASERPLPPPPPPMTDIPLRSGSERNKPTLVLTREELAAAPPVPARLGPASVPPPAREAPAAAPRRRSRSRAVVLLVAAVVTAIVVGVVGGLLAGRIMTPSTEAPPPADR